MSPGATGVPPHPLCPPSATKWCHLPHTPSHTGCRGDLPALLCVFPVPKAVAGIWWPCLFLSISPPRVCRLTILSLAPVCLPQPTGGSPQCEHSPARPSCKTLRVPGAQDCPLTPLRPLCSGPASLCSLPRSPACPLQCYRLPPPLLCLLSPAQSTWLPAEAVSSWDPTGGLCPVGAVRRETLLPGMQCSLASCLHSSQCSPHCPATCFTESQAPLDDSMGVTESDRPLLSGSSLRREGSTVHMSTHE